MFYISSRTEDGLVGVTDTTDNVEEFFTVAQLKKAVIEQGIRINGTKINSQGRLRLHIFDIDAYNLERKADFDKARYNLNFGSSVIFLRQSRNNDGATFYCNTYLDFMYEKAHRIPKEVSFDCSWHYYKHYKENDMSLNFASSLINLAQRGIISSIYDKSNFVLPNTDKFLIPVAATDVCSYTSLISSFSGGQTIYFGRPLLNTLDRFLNFRPLMDYEALATKIRNAIYRECKQSKQDPQKKAHCMAKLDNIVIYDSFVNNLRLSNEPSSVFKKNPYRDIWGRDYKMGTPVSAIKIDYSFNNVDLRGSVIIGSGTKQINNSFTYTTVEEIVFKPGMVDFIVDSFNDNYNLKKVVFEEGFRLMNYDGIVFRDCPNAIFYVSKSFKSCSAFNDLHLDSSRVVFT